MPCISLSDYAKLTKISWSKAFSLAQSGSIAAKRLENDSWVVDIGEIHLTEEEVSKSQVRSKEVGGEVSSQVSTHFNPQQFQEELLGKLHKSFASALESQSKARDEQSQFILELLKLNNENIHAISEDLKDRGPEVLSTPAGEPLLSPISKPSKNPEQRKRVKILPTFALLVLIATFFVWREGEFESRELALKKNHSAELSQKDTLNSSSQTKMFQAVQSQQNEYLKQLSLLNQEHQKQQQKLREIQSQKLAEAKKSFEVNLDEKGRKFDEELKRQEGVHREVLLQLGGHFKDKINSKGDALKNKSHERSALPSTISPSVELDDIRFKW